ncbi:hypothetical protein [Streptomyces sp. NPDC094049]|uniref:hypothetical protein n=1 Tax=Streptomyces sp. NPDC094049 TaxID=3154987 RepID=UPI00331F3934
MSTQYYNARINITDPKSGDMLAIYHDFSGPAGLSPSQARAIAVKAALAEVPGGRVEGSQVSTDGKHY